MNRHPSVAAPLATTLLWALSVAAAAALVAGGSPRLRAAAIAICVLTTVLAFAPRAGRGAVWAAAALGCAGFAVLVAHVDAEQELAWPIVVATTLFGYGCVAVAGLAGLLWRRSALGLLVSATTLTLVFGVAELSLSVLNGESGRMNPAAARWVGGPVPHPVLQESYAPNTEARTIYPSDPRGYFGIADPRSAQWQLSSHHAGSAGRLLFPGRDAAAGVRVEIDRAEVRTPHHLQLSFAQLSLGKDVRYVIAFRARAAAPRPITFAVTMAHAPWQPLGIYRHGVEIGTAWRDVVDVFVATAADEQARVIFDLGADLSAVEIQDVEVKRVGDGTSAVHPASPEHVVTYRFNSQGCRGPDYAVPAPPGRRRILALGDSMTLGVGVHEPHTFTAQLQAILDGDGSGRYDVINCGVSGYATEQERLMFEIQAPVYRPDIVVLAMAWNDNSSWRSDVEQGYFHTPGRYEHVMQTVRMIQAARYEGRKPATSFDRSLAEVRRLLELCDRAGIHLVVVAFRNVELIPEWQLLNRTVSAGLAGTSAAWLDLGERMLAEHRWQELIVHPDDYHPNEIAHRSAAEQIAALLRSRGWVAQAP